MSDLQEHAARNNAHWCDIVCRLHGLEVHLDERLWWTSSRSPDFYPDAVTLHPGVTPDEVLNRVDVAAGCSVKDSFAALDLEPAGFRVLFEAQWIGRDVDDTVPDHTVPDHTVPDHTVPDRTGPDHTGTGGPPARAGLSWRPVHDLSDLHAWVTAHGEAEALLPSVLAQPDLRLFLAADGDEVRGGLAFSRSTHAVGVSNLFATGVDPALVWDDVAGLASRSFPGLPIVGYEAGDDLVRAQRAGFTPLGPLRIWIR
jgi:hypothetical protein